MIENVILTVTDVNRYIKTLFDYDQLLSDIMVEGEVSNYKRHSSGHLYFSIKDNKGKINCVMFKSDTYSLDFEPMDGMKVIIEGNVSVFEKNGNYQLYVRSMRKKGVGKLYEEYNRLLEELRLLGYFDNDKKKQIPKYVRKVAVVTSKTGAAVRDIISVIQRRNKNIQIIVCPVKVQGAGSAEEIAQMIYDVNRLKLADVIITGRGGGSIEELWAFNERVVAQAVYDSSIPVVSAVGHETDFTIADFVADLRAPTPSAAAELAVSDIEEIKLKLYNYNNRFKLALKKKVELMRMRYEKCMASRAFKEPLQRVNEQYIRVDMLVKSLQNSVINKYKDRKNELLTLIAKLDSLSPLKTLTRGYCIVQSEGKAIKSVKDIKMDEEIELRFVDGKKKAKVLE